MALFFKDRIPDKIHGQSARFYDAVADDGGIKLADFKLELKNNIAPENQGDPVSAGNLNYASGNFILPVAKGQNISKGQFVTLTPAGASLANTRARTVAATGSHTNLQTVLKLTDNKLLLVYRNASGVGGSVTVADIDWAARSIIMGSAQSITNVDTLEVINGSAFCFLTMSSWNAGMNVAGSAELHLCTVNGRVISVHPSVNITGGTVTGIASIASNPAKMSDSSVLVVHEYSGTSNYHATVYNISGSTFLQGGTLNTFAKSSTGLMRLESVNNGGGRFILYTRSSSNYAYTARTIGFPGVQTVNMGDNGGNLYIMPRRHGVLRFGAHNFITHVYSSAGDARVININPASGAMSFGAAQRIPGIYDRPDVTYDSAGNLLIIGPVYRQGFVELSCLETAFNNTSMIFTEYNPFRDTRLSTGSLSNNLPTHIHWGLAVENMSNPGEFLFMRHSNTGSMSTVQFSFGYKGDSAGSANAAGIALDNSGGGSVRVQVTGKLMPDLWTGLRTGVAYSLGINGGLAAYDGSLPPVGMAASDTDFIYYGAGYYN